MVNLFHSPNGIIKVLDVGTALIFEPDVNSSLPINFATPIEFECEKRRGFFIKKKKKKLFNERRERNSNYSPPLKIEESESNP